MIVWNEIPIEDLKHPYQVSRCGKVRNARSGRLIVSWDKRGYRVTKLMTESGRKSFFVHQLVAITYIPNPRNKPSVNHKNFQKDDNRVENLEWVTQKENIRHSSRAGRMTGARGTSHWKSKLTAVDVKEIRQHSYSPESIKTLARKYDVCPANIKCILERKTWKHVS